jgi:hypothetical protein
MYQGRKHKSNWPPSAGTPRQAGIPCHYRPEFRLREVLRLVLSSPISGCGILTAANDKPPRT